MMERIIEAVVSEMQEEEGLDSIKTALRIAIKVSGRKFSDENWNYMMTEILYRLSK